MIKLLQLRKAIRRKQNLMAWQGMIRMGKKAEGSSVGQRDRNNKQLVIQLFRKKVEKSQNG